MKRLVSGLLFGALFAGQTALLVAHEWRVAAGEAGHHVGLPAGPEWSGPEDSSEGHEHHDPISCGVCPKISQSRCGAEAAPSPRRVLAPSESRLAATTPPSAGLELSEARSPRGPPAFA